MTKTKGGRGYYFRQGRGWVANVDGHRSEPLCYADGSRIKDERASDSELKDAYARWRLTRNEVTTAKSTTTVEAVLDAYLQHAKVNGAASTYDARTDTLFDFAYGLPPRFRKKPRKATPAERIHQGYGNRAATSLIHLDIDQWLQAHAGWSGCRKTRVQAVKRAFSYAAEKGMIPHNPLKGYRPPKTRARVTYLTDEQEAALLKLAPSRLGMALRVLIRTGARPGIEFANLTAAHVIDNGARMEWRFKAEETKTGRPRVIRIADPDILEIVRTQIRRNPTGAIFRNEKFGAWHVNSLSRAFRRLVERVERKAKIKFDSDVCLFLLCSANDSV